MDISKFTIVELKALGFEIKSRIEQEQQNLNLVQSEIMRKSAEEVEKQRVAEEGKLRSEVAEAEAKKNGVSPKEPTENAGQPDAAPQDQPGDDNANKQPK